MTARLSTTDRIHLAIREAILSGELASGSLHSIYQLAERFGVSRTPVRDAVLRLADVGMLDIERNRGVRVRGLRVSDVREIFETRLLLEVPATAHAAATTNPSLSARLQDCLTELRDAADSIDATRFMRSDRELHRTLIAAAGNPRLSATVEALRDATQAYGISTAEHSRSLRQIQREHEPIVAAVIDGDSLAAARLMHEHLVETAVLLMAQASKVSGEPVPVDWPGSLVASP